MASFPAQLPLPVFHSPLTLLHNPPHEILSGALQPYIESPERVNHILASLLREGQTCFEGHDPGWTKGDVVTPELLEAVRAVHEEEYVEFLSSIYQEWTAEGGSKDAALPETFLRSDLLLEPSEDRKELSRGSAIARVGRHSFDLSAPITSVTETYLSALASARLALAALSHLVSTSGLRGSFALCRPPGHHSTPTLCGGYCFLNNAAIAARFFQSSLASSSTGGKAKVAILDIDYHHGNGTSKVFYNDPSVLYVSLHAEGDYPWYTGSTAERGGLNARAQNRNFPLPLGTGERVYLRTLQQAVHGIQEWQPDLMIVSLGVDTYIGDPLTDFKLTLDAYPRIGQVLSSAGVHKTLFVMEGGYCLEAIGDCVKGVLEGFRGGD
ncbi:hypothetical protein JCM8547_002404 [Rhodosporidiobolus lusitaniae]